VCTAVRAAWPAHLPLSVRISAHDWVEGGITPDDAVEIARAFKAVGVDMIDVSSGQVSPAQKPTYGRMYQTPFADRIRQEAGIATIAVGAISEADHVNSIIAAGRADLCAVARPHLANPAWTLTEAARIGYTEVAWPRPYLSGKSQMDRRLGHWRDAAGAHRPQHPGLADRPAQRRRRAQLRLAHHHGGAGPPLSAPAPGPAAPGQTLMHAAAGCYPVADPCSNNGSSEPPHWRHAWARNC
jgi:hypothetical protein